MIAINLKTIEKQGRNSKSCLLKMFLKYLQSDRTSALYWMERMPDLGIRDSLTRTGPVWSALSLVMSSAETIKGYSLMRKPLIDRGMKTSKLS